MSLDTIEAALKQRLPTMQSLNARLAFDFADDGALYVDATQGPPLLSREAQEVDCTIRVTLDNFSRLLAGDLDPSFAFMTGKLKVQGSMGIALKLSALLGD